MKVAMTTGRPAQAPWRLLQSSCEALPCLGFSLPKEEIDASLNRSFGFLYLVSNFNWPTHLHCLLALARILLVTITRSNPTKRAAGSVPAAWKRHKCGSKCSARRRHLLERRWTWRGRQVPNSRHLLMRLWPPLSTTALMPPYINLSSPCRLLCT